jgi:DNA-binding beta-propeller fold protein YncE
VYAADSRADRIDAFSRSGRFLFSWGRSGSEPGELRQPLGLALDGQGHVYVADTGNDRVEEFSAHGRFLRTFGRTGRHSGDLSRPEGVSVGVDTGWIYVADTGNHRVQAFTPAGPPVRGWDAKYSQRGKLLRPTSLAVTNEGLVFVTDRPDEQVHVLDADGSFLRDVVSVPAPDFVSPSAVAQDTHDYQYVLDTGLASVRKLDPYGHVLATWHVPSHSARGLAVDGQGNVYVADTGRGQILAFAPGGTLRRSWTGGAKGAAPAVSAAAIAQDPDGKLYVADSRGNQVAVLALTGQLVRRLHGDAAFGPLRRPSGVAAAPDGRIYVADTGNNRIVRFSRGGSIEAAWNQRGSYAGPLNAPHGLGVDSHGYVLVADTLNGRVEELHPSGSVRRIWYVRISPPGRSSRAFPLTDPVCTSAYPCGRWTGLAVGPHGFIYATDTLHDLVVRLSPDGETLQQWGGPGSGPSQFRDPEGVAVSSIGTIYVADTGNHRVDVLSPGGKEIGVIQRGLRSPDYVLVSERRGAAGRLFVADAANGEVRVYAIRQ